MNLRTQSLGIFFGGQRILEDISLAVDSGSFVGVIGPNGSGKSTLLRCIYRALTPSGAVYFDDQPLHKLSPKQSAQKLAVVAQHNQNAFDFSVEDVVLMGRAPYKRPLEGDSEEDFQIVAQCLEQVGLSPLRRRNFSTLSGGEQQRVILARALAQQTPCLILDEPTNHLDVQYQLELLDIVKGLNITVLSALHDLNLAAMYCDHLYALKEGALFCEGTPAQVLTPQVIQSLFQVEAEVITHPLGFPHVMYQPKCSLSTERHL